LNKNSEIFAEFTEFTGPKLKLAENRSASKK